MIPFLEASTEFVNCTAGDALGYPAYFRVTFERSLFSFDASVFADEMRTLSASMRNSVIAVPVNDPVVNDATDNVCVIDFRVSAESKDHTVLDLLNDLKQYVPGIVYPDIRFSLVQRVQSSDVYGSQADSSRANTSLTSQQKHDDGSFSLDDLLAYAKWIVLVLVLLLIAFIVWEVLR